MSIQAICECEACGGKMQCGVRHKCPRGGPPLAKRVVNYVKAVARDVRSGRKRTDGVELARRLAICGDCELLVEGTCTHQDCGCPVRRKARWASSRCPKKLW